MTVDVDDPDGAIADAVVAEGLAEMAPVLAVAGCVDAGAGAFDGTRAVAAELGAGFAGVDAGDTVLGIG